MAHEIREIAAGAPYTLDQIAETVAEFRARLGDPRMVVMSIAAGEVLGPALAAAKLSVGLLSVPGFPEYGYGVCNDGSGIWHMPPISADGEDTARLIATRIAEERDRLQASLDTHIKDLDAAYEQRVAEEVAKRVAALPSPAREQAMVEEGKPIAVPGDDADKA